MVHASRVRVLKQATKGVLPGPVVYWMSRDQRVADNWALLYAAELATTHKQPLYVVFCLRKNFAHATERAVNFMLSGLEEVEEALQKKHIPFHFLLGEPEKEIPKFLKQYAASVVVSDFSPLRYNRVWKERITEKIHIPFYEVDSHNVVPCWEASPKQEFGAYTLRPKIHKLLPEYLEDFPKLSYTPPSLPYIRGGKNADNGNLREKVLSGSPPNIGGVRGGINWEYIKSQIKIDTSVPKVDWIQPGEKAATKALTYFLEHKLVHYDEDRNDPSKDGQSNLSPYIHFGHISAQRIVLEVLQFTGLSLERVLDKHAKTNDRLRQSAVAFIEELVVRKELSDNFCFYNPTYASPKGFPAWAKKTLAEHARDKRQFLYALQELEDAQTHDELWNAAQIEMVKRGKMHGYMRMYWAKKILEWTPNVSTAMECAIYLNDKYFLDGRDPNGYTGIAWSMGGVHDRAWGEREIFGKIRYMSYGGAKSKFDIKKYIEMINNL